MDDAPHISTLNEGSPPFQPSKPAIRSVKLLVKDPESAPLHPFDLLAVAAAQSSAIPTDSHSRKRRLSQLNDDVADDDELEEDQLIDEDEPTPDLSPKKRSPGKPKVIREKKDKPAKLPRVTLNREFSTGPISSETLTLFSGGTSFHSS